MTEQGDSINNPGDIPGIGDTFFNPESGYGATFMECENGDNGELAVTMPADKIAAVRLEAQRQGKTVEQYLYEIISAAFAQWQGDDGHDLFDHNAMV